MLVLTGAGKVVLAGNNTLHGDITVGAGTLELVTAQSAGLGAIRIDGDNIPLVFDGTIMPANRIMGIRANTTIDLPDVVAMGTLGSIDSTGHVAIPSAIGGVTLTLDGRLAFAGASVSLAPDGGTGTLVRVTPGAVNQVVTIRGAAGTVFGTRVGALGVGTAALWADDVSAALLGGGAVPYVAGAGASPTVGGGQTLEVIDHTGGAFTLPAGVASLYFSDAAGVASVTGNDIGGAVIAGAGGLDFTAGPGAPFVYAGDGPNHLRVAPGLAGVNAALGDGDNTLELIGGDNRILTGTGHNLITLGIGYNVLGTSGSDTVLAGPGSAVIDAGGTGDSLVYLGSGANVYSSGFGGTATIVGGSGTNTIYGRGARTIYFAGGTGQFLGAGTVVGGEGDIYVQFGSGAPTVPSSMLFAGTGKTTVAIENVTQPEAATVVGNPGGAATIGVLTGSVLDFAAGSTSYNGSGGTGTVVGVSGRLEVRYGAGLFLAPPDGNSTINVRGNATAFGTAAGDVLSSRDSSISGVGAPVVLVGGAGAETLSGVGGHATNTIFAGSGPERIEAGEWLTSVLTGTGPETLVGSANGVALFAFLASQAPAVTIENFSPARDYLTLIGFGTSEVAGALASAVNVGGSETLTLTGGTTITFHGFTGLTSASFF